jgi:hypothetical protein
MAGLRGGSDADANSGSITARLPPDSRARMVRYGVWRLTDEPTGSQFQLPASSSHGGSGDVRRRRPAGPSTGASLG